MDSCKESHDSLNFVSKVTSLNVANTMQQIYQKSDILKPMIEQEEVGIIGATYHVESGKVIFGDYTSALERLFHTKSHLLAQKVQHLLNEAGMLPGSIKSLLNQILTLPYFNIFYLIFL